MKLLARLCGVVAGLVVTWSLAPAKPLKKPAAPLPRVVEFNRDIRPILSNNCFACHGPDKNKRKADLRLDTEKDAFADLGGYFAFVPGKPTESEVYRKITAADAHERMPPRSFNKKLTKRQIALIKRWIEQGAKWQKHWSLIAPRRPAVPEVADKTWPVNPIDAFLLARLDQEDLRPSPEAGRRTLLRRLYFDLVGLPPTPRQVDAFLADRSPGAYDRVVERLLASPHFGERLAMTWLDLVRYADTNGYHGDNHRDIAPYRDYVINAFSSNMPFDRFTVEQLAGDLLPQPTRAQKIASGYNRLLMTTREGGAQPKEYLAKYAADRVRNASAVWLGATLGCCECHDHKFDPFKSRDFYSLAAFFADLKETAVGMQERTKVPDEQFLAGLKQINDKLAALKKQLATPTPELAKAQAEWEKQTRVRIAKEGLAWTPLKPATAVSSGGATLKMLADSSVLSTGKNPARDIYTVTLKTDLKGISGIRLEALSDPSFAKGLSRGNGNFVLTRFEVETATPGKAKPQAVPIAAAVADYSQNGFPVAGAINPKAKAGWAVDGYLKGRESRQAVFTFARPLAGGPGTLLTVRLKHESIYPQHNIGRFRLSLSTAARPGLATGGLPDPVVKALGKDAARRTAAEKEAVAAYYRTVAPALAPIRQRIAAQERTKQAKLKAMPLTLVSVAVAPRVMRVLPRGNWLDDSGPIVAPSVPGSLPPLGVKGRRANRLDLARWLVRRDNPLTARVFVNRLWKLYFGQGIVRTLEDFGSQGAWPTHPLLLDWLAVEFMDHGWDVKHLVRLLVTSRAYRQSSRVTAELRRRDPYNRLLARQARYRLDAEVVRDNALAVSGLLVRRLGGPSARPYQPPGYWSHLNFPVREYQPDKGPGLYRRGLYTYWCRTFLHPSLLAFDAPTREECTVERPRSNTPQQALVLLNDPTYVEAARVLAERVIRAGGKGSRARIQFAFRKILGRPAKAAEVRLLAALYGKHLKEYRADRAAAAELLRVGERPAAKDLNTPELAAWTSVARVLLNLHETITRP
jgi:hypothetical protein